MAEKDCISREAAFNAILKLVPKVDDDGYCWVIRGDAATAIDNIPAADVVSAYAYEQTAWERDTAIAQLAEIGKAFGETMDDAIEERKFYEFLWNTIQPNEMEQYISMYRAQGVPSEPPKEE